MNLCCHLIKLSWEDIMADCHKNVLTDKGSRTWEYHFLFMLFLLSIQKFCYSVLLWEYSDCPSYVLFDFWMFVFFDGCLYIRNIVSMIFWALLRLWVNKIVLLISYSKSCSRMKEYWNRLKSLIELLPLRFVFSCSVMD